MLRLVGNRFGPVLRTRPPVDSAAAQIEWSESMESLGPLRRSGRFVLEPRRAEGTKQDVANR